jgi:hypothetical protein
MEDHAIMKISKTWEILRTFKDSCKCHGWRTSENEDWIKTNEGYHNFLWIKDVSFSSFKRIVTSKKCIVREDLSYRVVEASYTAWLFSEKPSENVIKLIYENPVFSSKIALYDLSQMLEGKCLCTRLNDTDSPVFKEFESFLRTELKAKIKPVPIASSSGIIPDAYTVKEVA